ncbi:MAG: hypothetical protein HYT12_01620 [Candidatus Liptonbacteria bacterium]|nr:hypothetical protein [Candidatus Liptonbacteria bacterium]
MKRLLVLTLILAGLIAAGIGGYYIWQYYSETVSNEPKPPDNNNGGTTPPETTGVPVSKFKLVTDAALRASFDKGWAPPQFQENWVSADWSPDSSQVVYLETVGGKTNLGLFTPSNLKSQALASLTLRDTTVTWLNSNEIIISDKPSKAVRGSVWKYKIKEKIFEPVITEELGPWIQWDKNFNGGIKFSTSQGGTSPPTKLEASIIDNTGKVVKMLPFITFPDKCVFENALVFCAVPNRILSGANLPDDYLKGSLVLSDAFFSFNIKTGAVEFLVDSEGSINATRLKKIGNKLLFMNHYDDKLYEMRL